MDRITAGFDQLTRFWLETAPARGVVARLDESMVSMLQHHDYPVAVSSLLRQLVGAAALLASNLKQPAQVVLQAQGDGAVPLLCVEATDRLTLRAYANVREDANIAADADLSSLVAPDGSGRFVLTIAPEEGQMYQGIVALHAGSVSSLLADYLTNSQQTQTRLWLRQDGDALEAMLLERLPDSRDEASDSAWEAVVAQAETAFALPFMPFPYSEWLPFVFTGHDVRVHAAQPLSFSCSCTVERVLNALRLVGREELQPLIAEQGRVESRCEFCGKRYEVSATQLADLFDHVDASHPPGSGTVH